MQLYAQLCSGKVFFYQPPAEALLTVAKTSMERSMWVTAMVAACDLVILDVTAAAYIVSQVMHRLQDICTYIRPAVAAASMHILWQAEQHNQVTEVRSRHEARI